MATTYSSFFLRISGISLTSNKFTSYNYIFMSFIVHATGYVITDLLPKDILRSTLKNSESKPLRHMRANSLSELDSINRAALCDDMLRTSYFRTNGLRKADKQNPSIRIHLRLAYPASYELHYFEESSSSEPELIYPALQMTISSSKFLQELVLPCLAEERSTGKLIEFFISHGYKNNTFLIHERDLMRNLSPIAIMEGGVEVLDFMDNEFRLEDQYVANRSLEIIREQNDSDAKYPLLLLNENEKYRLAALIFDSTYYQGLELELRESEDIDYRLHERNLYFRSAKYMDLQWTVRVFSCKIYSKTDYQPRIYYIGWGYDRDHSVYLFRGKNEIEVYLNAYVKNITVLDGLFDF